MKAKQSNFAKVSIDLHGNKRKRETAPDGSKDENVFEISQGVSINLFVKSGQKRDGDLAKVYHYDLYGKRQYKYDFLLNNDLTTVPYREVFPTEPWFFISPKDFSNKSEYEKGFSVRNLFKRSATGIVSKRDNFTIHTNKEKLQRTITEFIKMDSETARRMFKLRNDVRDWSVENAQSFLRESGMDFRNITKILYRPFDYRFTYYHKKSRGFLAFPCYDIMKHIYRRDNVGIVLHRISSRENSSYFGVFISKFIIDLHLIRGGSYFFPLFLYADNNLEQNSTRDPNFNRLIINKIEDSLGLVFTNEKTDEDKTFSSIDLLDYIYAVLHSPTYRTEYKEFMKFDFPRITFPNTNKDFWDLVLLGKRLRELHTMDSSLLNNLITKFPIDGDNTVHRIRYSEGKVFINRSQYFEGVSPEVWEFYVANHQPVNKWLSDRKDVKLSYDDIMHYQKIVVAITETINTMDEIDEIIS